MYKKVQLADITLDLKRFDHISSIDHQSCCLQLVKWLHFHLLALTGKKRARGDSSSDEKSYVKIENIRILYLKEGVTQESH